MRRNFRDARFLLGAAPGEFHAAAFKVWLLFGIHRVIAQKLAGDFRLPVNPPRLRTFRNPHPPARAAYLADALSDHQVGGVRIFFFVFGIEESKNGARILYQSMLEAPSSGHKGAAPFAGKANGAMRARGALVGAVRGQPQAVAGFE